MFPLSIVLADRGDHDALCASLASVLRHRPSGCEVLVACRGDYDDPYGLAGEVGFLSGAAGGSFIARLKDGVSAARHEIVHLLAAGAEVREGWTDRPLHRFADPRVAAVSPLLVGSGGEVTFGVGESAGGGRDVRNTPQGVIGPTLAAGFYRKSALVEVGGLEEAVGEMLADLDLAMSLREAGWRVETEPACRVVADLPTVPAASEFQDALHAERLYRRHQPWSENSSRHAGQEGILDRLLGIFRQSPAAHCGRMAAWREKTAFERHHRRLRQADGAKRRDTANPPLFRAA